MSFHCKRNNNFFSSLICSIRMTHANGKMCRQFSLVLILFDYFILFFSFCAVEFIDGCVFHSLLCCCEIQFSFFLPTKHQTTIKHIHTIHAHTLRWAAPASRVLLNNVHCPLTSFPDHTSNQTRHEPKETIRNCSWNCVYFSCFCIRCVGVSTRWLLLGWTWLEMENFPSCLGRTSAHSLSSMCVTGWYICLSCRTLNSRRNRNLKKNDSFPYRWTVRTNGKNGISRRTNMSDKTLATLMLMYCYAHLFRFFCLSFSFAI